MTVKWGGGSTERMVIMDAPQIDPAERNARFAARQEQIREQGGFDSLLQDLDVNEGGPQRHRGNDPTHWLVSLCLIVAAAGVLAIWAMPFLVAR